MADQGAFSRIDGDDAQVSLTEDVGPRNAAESAMCMPDRARKGKPDQCPPT